MSAPIKTCEYCGVTGEMPTSRSGETACYDCLQSFPQTTRDAHREIVKLRAELKLAQAQRDAGNREIERLRGLLVAHGTSEHSHQCRACYHPYTPADGESEDCPRCRSDGSV